MIIIATKDDDEGNGVWIEVAGHAEVEGGNNISHYKICSSISFMMMTLTAAMKGEWKGNKSGYMRCYVPQSQLVLAEFVISGFQLLNDNYPGHLEFLRGDSRLFLDPETEKWNLVTLPSPLLEELAR